MQDFTNKVVLITGASSGIGAATAVRFAQAGAKLVLLARRLERLEQLAEKLKAEHNIEVHVARLDISNPDNIDEVVAGLPQEFKEVDLLVNNAGLAKGKEPFYEIKRENVDQVIDTNVKGLINMTRAILPSMVERNCGHVINIGSIGSHMVSPRGSIYCSTKYAVRAITQGLRHDLLGTKVRTSSIDPGFVVTEFLDVYLDGNAAQVEEFGKGVEALKPMDIADAIYYAASCPAHVNIDEIIILPTDQAGLELYHHEK